MALSQTVSDTHTSDRMSRMKRHALGEKKAQHKKLEDDIHLLIKTIQNPDNDLHIKNLKQRKLALKEEIEAIEKWLKNN